MPVVGNSATPSENVLLMLACYEYDKISGMVTAWFQICRESSRVCSRTTVHVLASLCSVAG